MYIDHHRPLFNYRMYIDILHMQFNFQMSHVTQRSQKYSLMTEDNDSLTPTHELAMAREVN